MSSSLYFKIGGLAGASIIGGLASGLIVWWVEESIQNEIGARPWLLPLLGGFAGAGAIVAIVTVKTTLLS